jgi:hypothetical protein
MVTLTIYWPDNTTNIHRLDLQDPRELNDMINWIVIAKNKGALKIVIE